MCIDITQKIPEDSVISRETLRRLKIRQGSAGHLILEVLTDLPGDKAAEFFNALPTQKDAQKALWDAYRERLALMLESDDEPTDAQKIAAFRDAFKMIMPWPEILPNELPEVAVKMPEIEPQELTSEMAGDRKADVIPEAEGKMPTEKPEPETTIEPEPVTGLRLKNEPEEAAMTAPKKQRKVKVHGMFEGAVKIMEQNRVRANV